MAKDVLAVRKTSSADIVKTIDEAINTKGYILHAIVNILELPETEADRSAKLTEIKAYLSKYKNEIEVNQYGHFKQSEYNGILTTRLHAVEDILQAEAKAADQKKKEAEALKNAKKSQAPKKETKKEVKKEEKKKEIKEEVKEAPEGEGQPMDEVKPA